MKFIALLPILAGAEDEITCYECEFTEFSDGSTAGDQDCVFINDNTPRLTDKKFGESCGSMIGCRGYRRDCRTQLTTGAFVAIGSAKDRDVTFRRFTRGTYTNFNDTASYDYEGVNDKMEYRWDIQTCGSNVDQCSEVVRFPISDSVVVNEKEDFLEEGSSLCYSCRRTQYYVPSLLAWFDLTNDRSCDTLDPDTTPPPEAPRPCSGQCITQAEEHKFDGDDFMRQIERRCHVPPVEPDQRLPDLYADMKVAELKPNTFICQSSLCNSQEPQHSLAKRISLSLALLIYIAL